MRMSVSSDGTKRSSDLSSRINYKFEESESFETVNKDSAFETEFRGFEKIPTVVLGRLDTKPYLNKDKKHRLAEFKFDNNNLTKDEVAAHLKRLTFQCSVKLVRDDLFKLKERFLSISPTSNMVNFKCKICLKEYSNGKKLLNHQENKHVIVYKPNEDKVPKRVSFSDHVIVHEVTEYHKCRKCTKIFENYHSLKAHMKENHKKRKCYICNYCKKRFVDRMFFKIHIKLHCDSCSELFLSKAEYTEHRKNVCRIIKKYKCRTCNESYFKFMDLKDHSYEHLGTFYICDICKDQFQSKCSVAHHIAFLHSSNHPDSMYVVTDLGGERVYLCNFCDQSVGDHSMIETHMQDLPDLSNRSVTGYKDYSFCDQCLKKFDKESDMLQHKWTHFLNNSDNSQIRDTNLQENKVIIKKFFNINEKIPNEMQPKVILERIKLLDKKIVDDVKMKIYISRKVWDTLKNKKIDDKVANVLLTNSSSHTVMEKDTDATSVVLNQKGVKALVDPKSKKTIISKYQCKNCGKYFSNNYCLKRHIETQHSDYKDLQCKVCEEVFVWPSLLRSHNCIRMNIPEMPFDDARPEIHFDNLHEIYHNSLDDLNIQNEDCASVDFDIPDPIVELTEYETFPPNFFNISNNVQSRIENGLSNGGNGQNQFELNKIKININPIQSLGYKVHVQEVPIEF